MSGEREHVVLVCTGNLCRSPMAEALLRRRLERRGVEGVDVSSAGTRAAWSGATEQARAVVAEMGGDLGSHRACRADCGLLESADLVVVMTADHVIDVAHECPEALDRVFKLTELVRLLGEHGSRRPGEPLRELARRLASGRSEKPWADSRGDPDVPDPMGESLAVYRDLAARIDAALSELVEGLRP